jgi:hypothetical protein
MQTTGCSVQQDATTDGSSRMKAATGCREHQDTGSSRMQGATGCREQHDAGNNKMLGAAGCS